MLNMTWADLSIFSLLYWLLFYHSSNTNLLIVHQNHGGHLFLASPPPLGALLLSCTPSDFQNIFIWLMLILWFSSSCGKSFTVLHIQVHQLWDSEIPGARLLSCTLLPVSNQAIHFFIEWMSKCIYLNSSVRLVSLELIAVVSFTRIRLPDSGQNLGQHGDQDYFLKAWFKL